MSSASNSNGNSEVSSEAGSDTVDCGGFAMGSPGFGVARERRSLGTDRVTAQTPGTAGRRRLAWGGVRQARSSANLHGVAKDWELLLTLRRTARDTRCFLLHPFPIPERPTHSWCE